MSATSLTSSRSSAIRPATIRWAAILLVLSKAFGFAAFLAPGVDGIPIGAVVFGSIVSVIVLVLTWWIWQRRKWAAIAVTVIGSLDLLASLPGLIAPPSASVAAIVGVGIPLTLVPLWLLWHPQSRSAYQ